MYCHSGFKDFHFCYIFTANLYFIFWKLIATKVKNKVEYNELVDACVMENFDRDNLELEEQYKL